MLLRIKKKRIPTLLLMAGIMFIVFGIFYPPNCSTGLNIDDEKEFIGFFTIFLGFGCLEGGILLMPATKRFPFPLKILIAVIVGVISAILVIHVITYLWVEGFTTSS